MHLIGRVLRELSWKVVLYWLLLLGMLWAFVELADEVYEGDGFFFDEPVLNGFYPLLDPTLTSIALGLSVLGGVGVMVTLAIIVTLGLLRFSRREAVFFGVSMTGASLIMVLTKYWFARERPGLFPDVDFWETASPSFPSGHATGSAAFFLALYLVIARLLPKARVPAALLGIFLALGISASRLYLQVHYPSDILAGLVLGGAWVLGVNMVFERLQTPREHSFVLLKLSRDVVVSFEKQARAQNVTLEMLLERTLAASQPTSSQPTSPKPQSSISKANSKLKIQD